MATLDNPDRNTDLNDQIGGTSTDVVDDENWVLVDADDEDIPKSQPVVERKPFFEFNLEVEINKNRHTCTTHGGDQTRLPLSNRVPRAKLEQSLLVTGQGNSPLFRLPLEIRFQIYDHLLRPKPTNPYGVRMIRAPSHLRIPTVLSILQTCQRALNEAEHIFYSSNRLWIDNVSFLQSLNPDRRSAVTSVAVPVQSVSFVLNALTRLQGLPNLQSLIFVRKVSVKYFDMSSWKLMMAQFIAQAKKLGPLKEFQFITPEATGLTQSDLERKEQLDRLDDRFRQAICGETIES